DSHAGCARELAALDRVRATAFASADPALLADVYVAGSPLQDVDALTIAHYRSRGGRVVGAVLQVSQCRELERTAATIGLEVVEALGPSLVRWDDGGATALPRDRPTRRQITLRHTADGWRISGSQPPAPTSGQAPGR
ncbi:MAG: hypothetical protein WCB95_09695, partial [Aeromicrobium sp.]